MIKIDMIFKVLMVISIIILIYSFIFKIISDNTCEEVCVKDSGALAYSVITSSPDDYCICYFKEKIQTYKLP